MFYLEILFYFRLLLERKKLHSDLDCKLKKLSEAQVQQPRDSNLHRDFEDEIEAIRANLDYVDDSIKELQENILQVEDSKVFYCLPICMVFIFLTLFYFRLLVRI